MANINGKLVYVSDETFKKLTKLADEGRRPKSTQIEVVLDYYLEHHPELKEG